MKIVSVDIETTGLDPKTSDVLEVGLVAYDSDEPFDKTTPNNALRIVLIKEEFKGNIFALNMNQDIISEIVEAKKALGYLPFLSKVEDKYKTIYLNMGFVKNSVTSPDEIIEEAVINFLTQNDLFNEASGEKRPRINIAGKNFAGFDFNFLKLIPGFKTSLLDRARHRIVDVGPMFLEPTDKCVPNLKTCLERAGIQKEVAHLSIDDAVDVLKCLDFKLNPKPVEFEQGAGV